MEGRGGAERGGCKEGRKPTLRGMSRARSGMCRSPITRIRKAMVRMWMCVDQTALDREESGGLNGWTVGCLEWFGERMGVSRGDSQCAIGTGVRNRVCGVLLYRGVVENSTRLVGVYSGRRVLVGVLKLDSDDDLRVGMELSAQVSFPTPCCTLGPCGSGGGSLKG